MAGKPRETYRPGELDKTRSNLGELSHEEARRMASILGGEIGIEKTSDELKAKYSELRKTSSKSSPSSRTAGRNTQAGGKSAGNKTAAAGGKSKGMVYSGHYTSKKNRKQKLSYLDRIRINRIASKPEHRIKKPSSVLSAYMSIFVKSKDLINPDFIIDGEQYYYSHIEEMVNGIRSLLKQVDPLIFRRYVNPFYRDILKSIIAWDLRRMSEVLHSLQKSPRNRDVHDCADLCRLIYRPVFILKPVPLKYITGAVDRVCRILMIVNSENGEELHRIEKVFLETREKIKTVFKDISYTCYPLLLNLSAPKFYYYSDFLKQQQDRILDFLELSTGDILELPEDLQELLNRQYSLNHLRQKMEEERKKIEESMAAESKSRNENEVEAGIEFLEQLFPESGWKNYRDYPDFYPYFHPIFKFPKGTELIAVEDPLQQVVVLASIIQDLLYGFRGIKIVSEKKNEIESLTDSWRLFIDDSIQKYYTRMLLEYCRGIEKGSEYSSGRFGQKMINDIYWFKRKLILPLLKFKTIMGSQSVPPKCVRFHQTVNRLYVMLEGLLKELDENSQREKVIADYNSSFRFEIENVTSRRLRTVLNGDNIAATNENLIRHTFSLISLMDYLLNSRNSPYYENPADEYPVYRWDPVYQGKPMYSVKLLDTIEILKKYQR